VRVQTDSELVEACGEDPGVACEWVFDVTGSDALAGVADFLIDMPLTILLIAVVAFVSNRLVRRAINRFLGGLAETTTSTRWRAFRRRTPEVFRPSEDKSTRAAARAQTLAVVLRSISSVVIYSIAGLLILGELGINLAPLIAGAGIAGVALGFGAQTLVKDCISGMFMLIEDQFGVGDVIDVGEAAGTVEAVNLRTTKLRDVFGTVWYVPNGEILRVANKSQQWARAIIDISVAYGTDIRHAESVIKEVAQAVTADERFAEGVLEPPELWGVEDLGVDGVVIRLVIKTKPAAQPDLMRELRLRLKEAFDREGISMRSPQRTILVRDGGAGSGRLDDPAELGEDRNGGVDERRE
jgi:small-conductance mechanosensitive channel